MHPDTVDMMRAAFDLGAENGLITNGIGIGEEGILGALLPMLRWIRVSLDAGSNNVYSGMHGVDPKIFDKVINGIALAVSQRDKSGCPVSIGISFLTSAKTAGDMLSAAALARGLGVDYIQFKPLQIHKSDWEYLYEDQSIVKEKEAELLAMQTPDFRVFMPKHEFYGGQAWKPVFCHGQHFSTSLAADGKLYVCCHYKGNPDFEIGDLNTQSFAQIWGSERRSQIVKSIDPSSCVPWCKQYQLDHFIETIRSSGKLIQGPVSGCFDGGWTITTAEASLYPPVLHHNFL